MEINNPTYLKWLEAAYVYYLHPENDPIMSDTEWDMLGRYLESEGVIKEFGSLFQMKEQDYPIEIRSKYGKELLDVQVRENIVS